MQLDTKKTTKTKTALNSDSDLSMQAPSQVLVVGSLGYDTIATPNGKVENTVGGSANYFALSSGLYAPVNLVGVVGDDYKTEDRQLLEKKGVNLKGLQTQTGPTFRWSGRYEGSMNEAVTLETHLNVFEGFQPQVPEEFKDSSFIFLANIHPTLQMEVLSQVKKPRFVGLDTMNFWIDSSLDELKKAISQVNLLLVNEGEARKLAKTENTLKAIKTLSHWGPEVVVVKRGEYGFVMYAEDQFYMSPAFPIEEVVDPTGAGDSFAGGFFGYLSQHPGPISYRTLQEACIRGTVIASFTVEGFGVSSLSPLTAEAVEDRRRYFDQVTSLR